MVRDGGGGSDSRVVVESQYRHTRQSTSTVTGFAYTFRLAPFQSEQPRHPRARRRGRRERRESKGDTFTDAEI